MSASDIDIPRKIAEHLLDLYLPKEPNGYYMELPPFIDHSMEKKS